MSAARGVVGGALALTFLQVLVANPSASDNASGFINLATGAINRLVNPSIPLIPDRRQEK